MNVKQLRYVLATLSQGSFSAAATREGVSVQAVSKAVSELEREIGGALFERASSGVHATALGEALAARARAVVRGYDDLARFVSSGDATQRAQTRFAWASVAPGSRGPIASSR
ncbi:helix-turn-helix domain-containing protein [Thermophilibacter immobilis]|uniref:LysR family transcriptional regulator n=1 Tax=Thermophilibacter immobilis TaxID=2779519 RepID=A0A7S7M9F8_9ACTN|nr:LysR family transcriptional regulator [Thermophilibacter immobilis]QOY61180.1 LysR family transcriptional regulator [Thermophilibacter immobilis]